MSTHAYVVLDVFTDVPLAGNPLAVFLDGSELSGELMQRTARELNLSETVFLLAGNRVRIFTPTVELPFAGHPVLGTAFVVADRDGLDEVRLETGAGIVPITLSRRGGQIVYGEMEQPIPTIEDVERADELLAALGVQRAELPVQAYRNGPVHAFVALPDERAVAALAPDQQALERLGALGVSCFALTGPTTVKSRMFAPGLGVPEDPATGSAAGPLALHLVRHGRLSAGEELEISQGVEVGRPSTLFARVEGSPQSPEQILVGGAAVLVARGQYRLI